MHTVEDAVAQFGTSVGIGPLSFDANGNAAVLVNRGMTIYLMKIAEYELEAVTKLALFGSEVSVPAMYKLLQANVAGGAVGSGRLAMDPTNGSILYQERFDVRNYDIAGWLERVETFVQSATFWTSEQAFLSMTQVPKDDDRSEAGDDGDDDDIERAKVPEPEHLLIRI